MPSSEVSDQFDQELLALAGDASSAEEDNVPSATKSRSGSPARRMSGKSSTKKGKKMSRRNTDSEEEGEASSGQSSPNSLRSAPMDESDSESDAGPTFHDDVDRYPLEGKFMDAQDKAAIMAMNEMQREQKLAERAQEVERDRQNRALRQLLKSRETETKKQDKKRKAGAADLADDQRKTARQRTKLGGGKVGEASTGIDSLKKARAEKNDRQRRRDEDKERNRGRGTRSDYSDGDADGDSEVEWDDKPRNKNSKSPDVRDAQPAELVDIQRVRVGRSSFAQVCFYPGFDEAITGTYVRISVGQDDKTGNNIYRMGLVKGFVEDRPYAIENSNGKLFKTTQYVRAAHGKAERNWPFISCSDQPFTEAEWNRYKQTCLVEGVPLPTKPKLIQKVQDINALIHRSWTEAELQEKLTKSGALIQKFLPIERNRLNGLIKEAKANGNDAKVEQYQQELDALEVPKLAYGTSLRPSPKKSSVAPGMSQQDRLALLNRQNRAKNAEEVRQAQINERRAARKIQAAVARGEEVAEDHSRRLKTRAKFKHDVADAYVEGQSGTNKISAASTPKLAADKPTTPIPTLVKMQTEKKGIPTFRRPLMDDEIIGAMDLGIDIDIV
ncbi:uncharacterized protein L3040_005659 [Drepanopeziza brunnea f. sp. 'multigermtubi']|uniref:RNA polymerase 2 transcription elongation factor n=1 Tax=Marssonina brunnea f. sp. multigermtubi (strain MB_m1) TaxID=1072389 RepID=K1W938_MARBU|nr:RNA polymerase 2 transcription elongation factor [Drepanopeziza brunnea f. sp. 'multigermtubi' MB_m1]EKD13725.1 RNA polymerase 2 transcription elongation factor [Drepanopeziza brunnea f. sp. 'multigermtubi' MB_m1]KAJ5041105.1 hypothetical protein L3040_005659 [Drepanopeziza brunnea f. sp. 'multigermtubi']